MRHWLELLGVPSYVRYGGLRLDEWAQRLHYRNENKDLVAGALPLEAFEEALKKHGRDVKGMSRWTPQQLSELGRRHRHPAVKLLSVAAIAAGNFIETERTEALTSYLADSYMTGTRSLIPLYAAGCLYRLRTVPALTAILDGG